MAVFFCVCSFWYRGLTLIYDCGLNVALYSCVCSLLCQWLHLIYDCGLNVAVFLYLLIIVPRVAFNL